MGKITNNGSEKSMYEYNNTHIYAHFSDIKRIVKLLAAICLLAAPALAAFDTGMPVMPSFSDAWAGLNTALQTKITWIVGIFVIFLVVAGVLYSLASGGSALISGTRGDVAGRSSNISNVFLGVGIILVAFVAITLIAILVI